MIAIRQLAASSGYPDVRRELEKLAQQFEVLATTLEALPCLEDD